jgi:iron complex outermembrane receptor protein
MNLIVAHRGARRHRALLIALLCGASASAVGSVAMAQSAPSASPGPASLGEVVVTARKRAERLLDVPVAGNALDAAAIQRYAATDINTIVQAMPQITVSTAGAGTGAIITVRGIGSTSTDASIEQEVTVNIDGVPTSRGRVIQQAFFDQDNVTVLKGPQALYFGKNSPAGVITIDSVSPGSIREGYARVGYAGESQTLFGEFAISQPLTDTLSARVAVRLSDMNGGYVKGTAAPVTAAAQLPGYLAATGQTLPGSPYGEYPGIKEGVIRTTFKWTPTDAFDATLKLMVADYSDLGDSSVARIKSCSPFIGHPAVIDQGATFAGRPAGSLLIDPNGSCSANNGRSDVGTVPASVANNTTGGNGGKPYADTFTNLYSLTMNYRLSDAVTLTSVTGYYRYHHKVWSDFDSTRFATSAVYTNDKFRSYSEELRLSTSFEGRLNFSGGLFYQNEQRNFNNAVRLGYLPPDPATGTYDQFRTGQVFTGKTYSAFGELNFKLADNVELAGGLRYSHEVKSGDIVQTFVAPAVVASAAPQGQHIAGKFSENNVSPQVTLSWHPAADVLVYAAYKEGFKSGGFSGPGIVPRTGTPQNQQFGAETVRGGEIGLKAANLIPGLSGDLTIFNYNQYGLQLTAQNIVTTTYFTQNAAGARVRGAELNLRYRVVPEVTLNASVGYNKTRFTDFKGAQCWNGQPKSTNGVTPTNPADPLLPYAGGRLCTNGVQDLSGSPLPLSADLTAIYGVTWEHQIGSSGQWSLQLTAEGHYSSKYYTAVNENPFGLQKPFQFFNLSGRLHSDTWDLALIGKNVTNTIYGVSGTEPTLAAPGQTVIYVGQPREIVLQLTRKF